MALYECAYDDDVVLSDCREYHHQVMDHSTMDHSHGHSHHMDHDSMNCTHMDQSATSSGDHGGMHHGMMVGVMFFDCMCFIKLCHFSKVIAVIYCNKNILQF